jgi:transposase-like protein
MPVSLFEDDTVELACPRCAKTTPKAVEWLRANDRYICPACNFEVILDDRDKQLAALDRPNTQ